MNDTMKRTITAMIAIAMVFSAVAIFTPTGSEATSTDGQNTIMFNVIGLDGKYINGATWVLTNIDTAETVDSGTTSNGGMGLTDLVDISSSYTLAISYTSGTTYSNQTNIYYVAADDAFEYKVITLGYNSSTEGVFGYISEYVSGTSVVLIDDSYVVTEATVTGNSFYADVANDAYTLLIEVPGYDAVMVNITFNNVTGTTIDDNITASDIDNADGNDYALIVNVDARDAKNTQETTITFGDDYNGFSFLRISNLSFETSVNGLGAAYNDLPIRMQIDLMGDGNGVVTSGEVDAFITALEAIPLMTVTDGFLTVDGIAYEEVAGNFSVALSSLTGDVFSTSQYLITYEDDYEAKESIDVGEDGYDSVLKVTYDSADLNRTYVIDLPDEYELNSETSSTQYVDFYSEDYNNFTVDPMVRSGSSSEQVTMSFNLSSAPTASAAVDESDYAYAYTDDDEVEYYIVGEDKEVIFNASASTDPNGNPLAIYTWDFGDGSNYTGANATVAHTYTTADSDGYNVSLTVTNHNGNESETVNILVKVDGIAPDAVIEVVTENPTAGESVSFSGINCTDDMATADDGLGVIAEWIWNFDDGSSNTTVTSTNGNTTHTFSDEGNYTVTLTVVDVGGNSASTTEDVTVLRAEMPTLTIQDVTFSSDTFEEGVAGTVSVLIENTGDYEAGSYTVYIYIVDGTDTELLTSVASESALAVGENVTVNVTCTFDTQGDYRLKITVVDDDARTDDSNDYESLTVDEAGWKSIAIFLGVIVVVGVIVALVYYRNRLPGKDAFKKGGPKDLPAAPKTEKLPPKEEPIALEEPKKKSSSGGKSKKR